MMKYTLDEALDEVYKIQQTEKANLSDHIIKLSEEVGEIAESYLLTTGYKLPKQSLEAEKAHLTEEAVDAIIVSLAILCANGASKQHIEHLLKQKLQKWEIAVEKKLRAKDEMSECSGCGLRKIEVNRYMFDGMCGECIDQALYDETFAKNAYIRNKMLTVNFEEQ